MIGAKAQPTNVLMPILQHRKNFTLKTGCSVRRIVHSNGKAEGVRYIDSAGTEVFQPAAITIVAGWTLNSVRMLLLSKVGEAWDPASGKGTLGRNLTHQVTQATRIFFDKPLNAFMGAGGLGIGISDFDGKEGLESHPGVLRGGNIRLDERRRYTDRFFRRDPPRVRRSVSGARSGKRQASNGTTAPAPSLPKRNTCLSTTIILISTPLTPINGDPLIRLTLDWTEHERAQGAMLAGVHKEIAKAMNVRTGEVTSRLLDAIQLCPTRVRTRMGAP